RRGEAGGHPGSASGSSRRGVLKSGWLKKQGGFVRSWHARWFVLRGEQLCYYKDEDENKILGSLFLPGSRVLERPPTPDDPNKYLLEILSGEARGGERAGGSAESTVLMASSQSDMEEWARALRRVIWAPLGGGVFGQRLEETVRWERQHCGHATVPPGALAGLPPAPRVVQQCVSFIRERGLAEEGLFRMPGQASLVRDLQRAFDCGERPSFDGSTDVHTVASLLKLYLRELPEPVVPFSAYADFLACAKLLNAKPEQGFLELSCRLQVLPPANYSLLRYICRCLPQ
uniref:Rho GTPase activating protein 22 n=1 Tax=Petromyzon marinus TaxID=7757 RepID=S4R9F9_PETMA